MGHRPSTCDITTVRRAEPGVPYVFLTLAVMAVACTCAEGAELQTWGHANAELNDSTAVAPGNVRRSTVYDARVATRAAPETLNDSFTYMSLPRSGRAKEGYN